MDAAKQKNLEQKQALCEKLEALDIENITPEIKAQAKAKLAEWFGEEYDEDQLDALK